MKKQLAIALPEIEDALHDLHAKYFAPIEEQRKPPEKTLPFAEAYARAQALQHAPNDEYFDCLYALAKSGDEDFLKATTQSLANPSPDIVKRACFVLGHSGEQRAVPMLLQLLEQGNAFVIGDVIWALGMLGDVRAVQPLHKLWTRGIALDSVAQALARLGYLDSLPFLVMGLRHPTTRVRLFTAGAIATIVAAHDPDEVRALWSGLIPRIEPSLQDIFVPVRVLAACILAQLGRPFQTLEIRKIFEMRAEPMNALQSFFTNKR